MAILWAQSLTPWTDPNGNPYSGAKAYFFDAGTTTPRTVYRDGNLGESHDHPVVANASGMFPAIFLPSGDYRVRLTDAADVTIWDVDGISTPATDGGGGGGGGDTPVELLFRTGMFTFLHGTGSLSGWVRANGRTIGDASSGAGERANADCQALFLHLWTVDPTLTVSGGRGASAASDWAASKTIALPDMRQRGFIGMTSMGSSAQTLIAAGAFDNAENGDTLGATIGASTITLTTAQLPAHNHGVNDPGHTHGYEDTRGGSPIPTWGGGAPLEWGNQIVNKVSGTRTTGITIQNTGSGNAHPNMQPSAVATCYIKL